MSAQLWGLLEVVKCPSTAEARRAQRSRRDRRRDVERGREGKRKAIMIFSLFFFVFFFSLRDLSGLCASAVERLFEASTSAGKGESGDRIPTDLVVINVSVMGIDNRPVPDLTRHEITIEEDGVKQTVESFARGESPSSFILAFDISDSETLKFIAQQIAGDFLNQIRSTDEVFISQIETSRDAVRDFAADKGKPEKALNGISSNNKAPLDSLITEAVKTAREKHKALRAPTIVITDGHSLSGTVSDRDVAHEILRQGSQIYFIILDDGRNGSRLANPSRVRQTRNLLFQIAEVSGGQAAVVKSAAEISVAIEQIIERVKNQYTLAYYPTNDKYDGSFRYLSVTVKPKDNRKVKIYAPLGYYAKR